jgi:nonsense-mediated mRNA decay protein 3
MELEEEADDEDDGGIPRINMDELLDDFEELNMEE